MLTQRQRGLFPLPPSAVQPVVPSAEVASRTFFGIDPGASGGIAAITEVTALTTGTKRTTVRTISAKTATVHDMWMWLSTAVIEAGCRSSRGVIERVGGFIAPRRGKDGTAEGGIQPGASMFNFGLSAGILEGFLIAVGIPYDRPTPQQWQKVIGIRRPRGTSKAEWKRSLLERAQQLFPLERLTLATGDALLLAEYCRRTSAAR